MQTRRIKSSRVVGLLEGAALGACLVAAVAVGASVNRQPDSGSQAWTDRLQAQAEAYREARIRDAWTERLTAVARERADEAYTARLNGLATEAEAYDRAMDAWTQRLNGLAERLAGW